MMDVDKEETRPMRFDNLDLIVKDVLSAARFFRDVLGLTLRVSEERYAELDSGPVTIMLSLDAMVPSKPAQGVILHFRVDSVGQALQRARENGATVLMELKRTDWGTESAMIAGPEDIVVDLYRSL
jgi:predicted enzyme related to lactoylglutathione lyase